jgi:heptosyltransferase III
MRSVLFTACSSSRSHYFPIKRALVIRGGALGDLILTLPIIRALRTEFDEVDVLANRRLAQLTGNGLYALDDRELAPFFVVDGDLPQRWRDYFNQYDLIVSYLHDPDGAFANNVGAGSTFIVGPYRLESGLHATEQLALPLRELGIAVTDWVPQLDLSDREIANARAEFPLPLLALHPGSGSAQKNWPIANWIALIRNRLAAGNRVVIVAGEADEDEVAGVREHFGDGVSYVIEWPLRRLAAFLAGATFIGHDSGISHLAAAAGARCLVLFGSTSAKTWAPRNENARVLPAPKRDLLQLRVEDVLHALGS